MPDPFFSLSLFSINPPPSSFLIVIIPAIHYFPQIPTIKHHAQPTIRYYRTNAHRHQPNIRRIDGLLDLLAQLIGKEGEILIRNQQFSAGKDQIQKALVIFGYVELGDKRYLEDTAYLERKKSKNI